MREDELATHVVDHYAAVHENPEIRLEEPYDADGRRGVVDVYVRLQSPERVDHVIELKGDAAVREATGANEVLRQYRRMERYFHADAAHELRPKLRRTEPGARFLLCFAPTPTCVYHVATHRALYASVDPAARVDDVPAVRTVAFLTGLDGDPADLGVVSLNADAPFGSEAFFEAVPRGSRLADSLDRVDDEVIDPDGSN
ncbi:hypothetical protein [Halorubrum laminariae]|uniref:DUF4365 domain-containing protein n=1 Tax=Halorubrum laminariae TaxID=1433523 RepID=A0ABD6C3M4_9EURY|nr:hypothetical protein [Halorubrum laminariae]